MSKKHLNSESRFGSSTYNSCYNSILAGFGIGIGIKDCQKRPQFRIRIQHRNYNSSVSNEELGRESTKLSINGCALPPRRNFGTWRKRGKRARGLGRAGIELGSQTRVAYSNRTCSNGSSEWFNWNHSICDWKTWPLTSKLPFFRPYLTSKWPLLTLFNI